MAKEVILTGIRANNDLTIGNYFGAILPIIDMAKKRSDDYQINMFIPDLHSFTTPVDHNTLYDQIMHNARIFAAAGLPLDNPNINLYRQSHIPAHSELTWILDCFTGFGEMSRMTQFKEKSGQKTISAEGALEVLLLEDRIKKGSTPSIEDLNKLVKYYTQNKRTNTENSLMESYVSVGLFNYPVLMAADILLYNAKYIPVGEDQTQHLEFTRDIAERMNSKFGEILTVPEPVKLQHQFFGNDQGLRIKDLIDPTKKMSKSDESGRGVIFLNDEPAVAAKKIMGATTDDLACIHFDREKQPGISNLLEILALLRKVQLSDIIAEFEGQTQYGAFKQIVASEVQNFLTEFQNNLAAVDDTAVMAKLEQSERELAITANNTLLKVQQAVGLRQRN